MVPSRASEDRNPTPSMSPSQPVVTTLAPAAEASSQALVLSRDAVWLAGVALVYLALVVLTVLTLNPYFSQTWDAVTFAEAGKTILSPGWQALYEQSRAGQVWPYAYPPLHALVVAPFVALAGTVPDFVLVRVPSVLFDIALGVLLYFIVARKTGAKPYARLALLVWLLNPVTWYDTAVQGHFEAEWLFFVALAYWLAETKRGWLLPTLALAAAFLFKQNAILFALPFWASMLFSPADKPLARRAAPLASSVLVFGALALLVSLPFLLYSNDYLYMNVQYVADVPLQTQSWLVGVAGALGTDNILLQASSALTLFAAALISFLAVRRGMSLWLAATFIVLAFFLLSKKVVGYYYVMLLPFAIVTLVPTRRFRLLSLIVVAIAFVSLSPYFASWADRAHWSVYALLGILNSLLWLGIFIWLWRQHPLAPSNAQNPRVPAFLSLALFGSAVAAALLQPLVNSQTSPIRAPLVAEGFEPQLLPLLFGFFALVGIIIAAAALFTRSFARERAIPAGAYALVVLLAPLYFLTFTLTKESTAALEVVLTGWGW